MRLSTALSLVGPASVNIENNDYQQTVALPATARSDAPVPYSHDGATPAMASFVEASTGIYCCYCHCCCHYCHRRDADFDPLNMTFTPTKAPVMFHLVFSVGLQIFKCRRRNEFEATYPKKSRLEALYLACREPLRAGSIISRLVLYRHRLYLHRDIQQQPAIR